MSQNPTYPHDNMYAQAPLAKPSGMAVAAMVLGIISLVMFCAWYISIPVAIVGLVLGVIASGKAKRGEGGGAGMAKAGIICSIIALALDLIIAILAIIGFSMFGHSFKQFNQQLQQQIQQQQRMQQQQAAPSTQP